MAGRAPDRFPSFTPVRVALVVVMVAGAVSFSVHHRAIATRRPGALLHSAEVRALFALLVAGSLALWAENRWYGTDAGALDALFQFTSAITTTGFATTDLSGWSPSAHLLLGMAMLTGGCAGATTGGLKLKRVLTLAWGAWVRIRGAALHPWRLMEHKPIADADEEAYHARLLEAAATMATLFALATMLGTLVLLHTTGPEVGLDRVFLEIASALGNVGLSAGIATPELHWVGKLVLVVAMWMGRLEIVPVLVLLAALGRGIGGVAGRGGRP